MEVYMGLFSFRKNKSEENSMGTKTDAEVRIKQGESYEEKGRSDNFIQVETGQREIKGRSG